MTSTDSPFALKDGQRGLVVSTRAEESEPGTWKIGRYLDPQDLRWALLFWDKLAWPTSYIPTNANDAEAATIDYLQKAKVLVRPEYAGAARMHPPPHPMLRDTGAGVYSDLPTQHLRSRINSLGGRIPENSHLPSPILSIALRHLLAFLEADSVTQGAWALANDLSSMLEESAKEESARRGLLVSLLNCIPVPDSNVPLAEVLEFKSRRNDQLMEIRHEVESLYLLTLGDSDLALRAAKERIDSACADAIKVARESRLRFRLSAVKVGFTLPVGAVIGDLLAKGLLSQPITMPAVDALLVGAAGALACSWDIVPRAVQPRNEPYRYIASMHRELS
ncbi:DUF6236 family protein [Achromobacter spanius]|uniref:DUF6236 family protein n=1 Tax=Achromobacter spanius TaxID=217203 RepID=UPI00320A8218